MTDTVIDNPATETTEAAKPKRKPAEVHNVEMADGRTVAFTGKTKLNKEILAGGSVRFDFRNGYTRTVSIHDSLYEQAVGHGVSQKCGDATSGIDEVDDMQVAFDNVADRLEAGNWDAERRTGDGFSGASIVIRAIVEAKAEEGRPTTVAQVKAFLENKLAAAKERGEELTRQDLYKSFRKPGTRTAAIIERLERDKAVKAAVLDGDDLLAEIPA